jgi:hypothetical protein
MKLLNICCAVTLALAVAPVAEAAKPGTLVDKVRQATAHYQDVNVAIAEGYVGGPCVSGPSEGAMGIHFVKGSLLGDGALDVSAVSPPFSRCARRRRSARGSGRPPGGRWSRCGRPRAHG